MYLFVDLVEQVFPGRIRESEKLSHALLLSISLSQPHAVAVDVVCYDRYLPTYIPDT